MALMERCSPGEARLRNGAIFAPLRFELARVQSARCSSRRSHAEPVVWEPIIVQGGGCSCTTPRGSKPHTQGWMAGALLGLALAARARGARKGFNCPRRRL